MAKVSDLRISKHHQALFKGIEQAKQEGVLKNRPRVYQTKVSPSGRITIGGGTSERRKKTGRVNKSALAGSTGKSSRRKAKVAGRKK